MKMIVSEADTTEVTAYIEGESVPSNVFIQACIDKEDMIKIWKMIPISFLEANGFIISKI